MKVNKYACLTFVFILVTSCFAKDGVSWREWQESLDLAYPEDLVSGIQLQNAIITEGEPILLSCKIKNIKEKAIKIIIAPHNRTAALFTLTTDFSVKTNKDIEFFYRTYVHIDVGLSPESERLIAPQDSFYVNAILWPDNFVQIRKLHSCDPGLKPGHHEVSCKWELGAKFYPIPARTLYVMSDSEAFTIQQNTEMDPATLSAYKKSMATFFGYGEGEDHNDSLRNESLQLLDKIYKSDSYLALYAHFAYISILAYSRDIGYITKAISEAGEFLKKYHNSILREEMDFLIVKMIFWKEGASEKFSERAKEVMTRYPKNINVFEIEYMLEEK